MKNIIMKTKKEVLIAIIGALVLGVLSLGVYCIMLTNSVNSYEAQVNELSEVIETKDETINGLNDRVDELSDAIYNMHEGDIYQVSIMHDGEYYHYSGNMEKLLYDKTASARVIGA